MDFGCEMTEGEKSCPVCQHMLSESKEISSHPSSSFAVSLPSLPLLHRVCMGTGPGSSPLEVEGCAEPWLYPASGWSHCASSLLPSLLSPQIWAPSYTAIRAGRPLPSSPLCLGELTTVDALRSGFASLRGLYGLIPERSSLITLLWQSEISAK